MAEDVEYQALYRRYRPRRFSELRGQDHVALALQNAVRHDRVGHAYLFSGPRGTGKTTTARILAKALNCESPVDGEPCCACGSCLAVQEGSSFDVLELDSATNNSVNDIRDLTQRLALATPGRNRVVILDEVHMLSKAAEAAFLKTLEEPPAHVVFILATTDPDKVGETIRSRTQHLQFNLIGADELAEHVRWVASDAGIDLDAEGVDAVIRRGGGSARDTLSALELLAATGGRLEAPFPIEDFVEGLVSNDPGRLLTAVATAVAVGRDPRGIAEELVRHLRDAFLTQMAPEVLQVQHDRIAALSTQAERIGLARLVRIIEALGSATLDMRNAPDQRVVLEVALLRLVHRQLDNGLDGLAARLERLEREVAQRPAVAEAPVPVNPSTGRAVLGGRVMRDPSGGGVRPTSGGSAPARVANPAGAVVALDDLVSQWEPAVVAELSGMRRAVLRMGKPSVRDGVLVLTVKNASEGKRLSEYLDEFTAVVHRVTGTSCAVVVEALADPTPAADGRPAARRGDASPTTARSGRSSPRAEIPAEPTHDDEPTDIDEIRRLPDATPRSAEAALLDAFPDAVFVEEE